MDRLIGNLVSLPECDHLPEEEMKRSTEINNCPCCVDRHDLTSRKISKHRQNGSFQTKEIQKIYPRDSRAMDRMDLAVDILSTGGEDSINDVDGGKLFIEQVEDPIVALIDPFHTNTDTTTTTTTINNVDGIIIDDIGNHSENVEKEENHSLGTNDPLQNSINLLTPTNLESIGKSQKIDDAVVNFFISYFRKRLETEGNENYYILNPYLYGNIDRKNILNWTKGVDIFSYPYLIIPLHTNDHWALLVCTISSAGILATILDSSTKCRTPFNPEETINIIRTKYLEPVWRQKKGSLEFPPMEYCVFKTYTQRNSVDCGVCMIQYIDILTKGIGKNFSATIENTIKRFNTKIATMRGIYRDIIKNACQNGSVAIQSIPLPASKGISNESNHCYSNAALQILFRNVPFMDRLVEIFKDTEPSAFMLQFLDTYHDLISNDNESFIDVSPLRECIFALDRFKNFKFNQQQDSHEFLLFLLEVLEKEIVTVIGSKYVNTDQNPIYDYFGYQVSRTYQCNECGSNIIGDNIEYMLPLNLSGSKISTTVYDLVRNYYDTKERNIEFNCREGCISKATSSTSIERLPKTPIMYLISPDISTKKSTVKKNLRLESSLQLSCSDSTHHFNLYGIVHHIGNYTTSGHYVSYVKSDCWEYFDDSIHHKVSEKSVLNLSNGTPYILFYREEKSVQNQSIYSSSSSPPPNFSFKSSSVESETEDAETEEKREEETEDNENKEEEEEEEEEETEDDNEEEEKTNKMPYPIYDDEIRLQHMELELFMKLQKKQDRLQSLLFHMPPPINPDQRKLQLQLMKQMEEYEETEINLQQQLVKEFSDTKLRLMDSNNKRKYESYSMNNHENKKMKKF